MVTPRKLKIGSGANYESASHQRLRRLGVLKVQVDLHRKGYIISVPLTEHAPFDLTTIRLRTLISRQTILRFRRDFTHHILGGFRDEDKVQATKENCAAKAVVVC